MKFIAFSFIAIILFGVAAAITQTKYTDNKCTTPVATSAALANPFVATLNTCTKYMSVTSPVAMTIYLKATVCVTGGKVTGGMFSDDKCATKLEDLAGDEGKCVMEGPAGSAQTSMKITCDPASSVTLASIAVAAAVLVFCL